MPYKNPADRLAASHRWHQNNKRRSTRLSIDAMKRRARDFRARVDARKSVPCADCGGTFPPVVMDFDHLPQFEKCFAVSEGLSGNASWRRIEREIAKCEVVCSNCHRIRTFAREQHRSAPQATSAETATTEGQMVLFG